jgi:hypothetical protein
VKKIIWILPLVMVIASCGNNNPTEAEIRSALASKLEQKGCASSVLFKDFPIDKSMGDKNGDIIKPFIDIGFIQKSGDYYVLAEKGSRSYDKSASGFCYTERYNASDISVVKEEPKDELPPALTGAWYVAFKISPDNVEEWVKNQQLIQAASLATLNDVVGTHSFTVRMAKKRGEDQLIIADPRFSFNPGIHFNMGW